ncbi:M20/M25/M40 family metallo-hydrolase [Nocardioides sp. DS6]|uniref:M20/M25/M40 family metallo-hydrolase n=1 Tax=Nocardioides eburneus TaxID=3231482 RepID=A0ABV3SZ19_9ACTN
MTDPVAALQALVRIPTVSSRDAAAVDHDAFERLAAELRRWFPLLHERLELTPIADHAFLARWRGASDARPVILMAHLDVVPPAGAWTRDPFGGELADGAVHGRGALDDKGCVVAICAAVESLLARGVTPAYDVWLSFGCDEEVSGGAAQAAVEELRRRGVRPWFVLDEGGAVATEAFPGVFVPVAVVGVAEKGTTSLELSVTGDGGHASTPRRRGPTVRLARAIRRLDRAPMPVRLPEPTVELFRRMAPHAPAPLRPVLRHADRLAPALARVLTRLGPEPAALVRTTVAITTLSGSPALNVIASTATAGVNVRVMVGETAADVVARLRDAIADDRVRIRLVEEGEPSPVSPRDDAFAHLEDVIGAVFPDAVVAPYVVLAATDARFFHAICERVYRFAPFRMTPAQRRSIHAADEHLRVDDLIDGVGFYERLIEGLGRPRARRGAG